nr:MAG TPA: hypothetical protein [Caudoviricetes sp.]
MIKQRVGESTADEDIAFIEDASDTINSMSQHETEIEQLKVENEELRKKYRDRFFEPKPDDPKPNDPEPEKTTFESLFSEEVK